MNKVNEENEILGYLPSFTEQKNLPKFSQTVPKVKCK